MSEKIAKPGIRRDDDRMYYIKGGDVWSVPRKKPGLPPGKAFKEASLGIETDDRKYLYFIDGDGDVARQARNAAERHAKSASAKRPPVNTKANERNTTLSKKQKTPAGKVKSATALSLISTLRECGLAGIRGVAFELPKTFERGKQPLFQHQAEAVDAFRKNSQNSGIISLPTGAGKTRVAIEIVAQLLNADPKHRVIWASYPLTLIRQSMLRIAELGPMFPDGTSILWKEPGQSHKDLFDAEIVMMMREDLAGFFAEAANLPSNNEPLRKALNGSEASGVTVIYDECHQLGAPDLQYAIRILQKKLPPASFRKLRFVGFSATPLPTDVKKRELLKEVVFPIAGKNTQKPEWGMMVHADVTFKSLVEKKILCPINPSFNDTGAFDIPSKTLQTISKNLAGPKNYTPKGLGDFAVIFNNKVMSSPAVINFIADRIAANFYTLGKTLVFVPTIEAANELTRLLAKDSRVGKGNVTMVHSKLNEFGEDSLIDPETSDATEITRQIEAFKAKGDKPCVMVNVGMLTTGFDDPLIRTVVLGRLTFSHNLYWQMIGRGTRGPACGGTSDCFVIDVVRLTNQFNVLEGYKPDLKGSAPHSAEPDAAAESPMPVRSRVPASKDTTISSTLRKELKEVLVKFLRDPLANLAEAARVAKDVTIEMSTDKNGVMVSSLVPLKVGVPRSSFAPEYALNFFIEGMEAANPEIKLAWIRSKLLPGDDSEVELKLFTGHLEFIRKHSLFTYEAYVEKMNAVMSK